MTTYQGRRQPNGAPWVVVHLITPRGASRLRRLPIAPSLRLFNHSPSGFEWGYGGSGPAQLALAILLDYGRCKHTSSWAVTHHQAFKWAFVAKWPREGFKLRTEEIEAWERSLERETETAP